MKTATIVRLDRVWGFSDTDVAVAFFLPLDSAYATSGCSTPAPTAWRQFLLSQFRSFRFPVP